jgi:hypothetical protein
MVGDEIGSSAMPFGVSTHHVMAGTLDAHPLRSQATLASPQRVDA